MKIYTLPTAQCVLRKPVSRSLAHVSRPWMGAGTNKARNSCGLHRVSIPVTYFLAILSSKCFLHLCFLYESNRVFISLIPAQLGNSHSIPYLVLLPYYIIQLIKKYIYIFFSFIPVITCKFYSLSKFQLYNTVLSSVVTMFYTGASDLIHLTAENSALNSSLICLMPRPWSLYLFPWSWPKVICDKDYRTVRDDPNALRNRLSIFKGSLKNEVLENSQSYYESLMLPHLSVQRDKSSMCHFYWRRWGIGSLFSISQ